MQGFTPDDHSNLHMWVISFDNDCVRAKVMSPLRQTVGLVPASLQLLIKELSLLAQALQSKKDIDPNFLPLLKQVVIWNRRNKAASVEKRGSQAYSVEVLDRLQDELAPFSRIMGQDWFKETPALRSPRLTNYLTIARAEELLGLKLNKRAYDEKFNILLAPTLFLPDLAYFRGKCELRDQSVSVAYVDIDEFKSFNDCYGHEQVDRDILPRFMSEMESHVFSRGFAYRIGGDEYLMLLPNMSRDHAIRFLSEFQCKLKAVDYFQVAKKPKVSIGVCEIGPDSVLTDREVREKADKAHVFAKQAGRDRIAMFTDHTYQELEVMEAS